MSLVVYAIKYKTNKLSKDMESKLEEITNKLKKFESHIGDMDQSTNNTADSPFDDLNRIILENKWEACAIVLCILFGNEFNTDWLKSKLEAQDKKAKLQGIVNEFEINLYNETAIDTLISAFASLNGIHLHGCFPMYKISNSKNYQQISVICGKSFTECFIKHGSSTLIRDHFLFDSIRGEQIQDGLIAISKDNEGLYFERLLSDLRKLKIKSTFKNKQLKYPSFVNKLIRFFEKSEDTKQLLKNLDKNIRTVEEDDKSSRGSSATTPLIESASGGYVDIVYFLIDTIKSEVNNRDGEGRTPLYKASEAGKTNVVQMLLVKNADVNQCNMYNESPLYVACREKHKIVVDILLQNNASVNQYTSDKKSLLHAACSGGCHSIVALLLKKDVNVNRCDINIESPLYVACALGHTDIVEALLQIDAKVDQCDIIGQSPLYVSCAGGHTDIVHRLLAKGANANKYNRDEETPLYMACTGGYRDIVEKLLQKDADVSKCDSDGKSPLHVACGGGYKDVVDLLLNANANVNQYYSEQKEFPLYLACAGGYTDIVEMLLKKVANVSQCNSEGKSPLFVACTMGYTDIVELLLKWDAKVSQCNCAGASPLYVACAGGRTDIVKLLLQTNPDVSECTQSDKSPLHVVCDFHLFEHLRYRKDIYEKRVKDHIKIVELLISCNVDLSKMDLKNRTPLDIAKKSRCSELVNLLEKRS